MLTAEEKVHKARQALVELWRNRDIDREVLEEKLADAEMRPFGEEFKRRVTATFWIGSENEDELASLKDYQMELDDWAEKFNEDADEVVILEREDGIDVEFGPILRGNLPS